MRPENYHTVLENLKHKLKKKKKESFKEYLYQRYIEGENYTPFIISDKDRYEFLLDMATIVYDSLERLYYEKGLEEREKRELCFGFLGLKRLLDKKLLRYKDEGDVLADLGYSSGNGFY